MNYIKSKENLLQAKAYDLYYSMGKDRSYRKVAEKLGVSMQSVYIWSQSFRWKERIAQRDKLIADKIIANTDEQITNDMIRSMMSYRQILKASIGDYVHKLKQGKIKIASTSDFIRLVELDMKMADMIEKKELVSDADIHLDVEFIDNKK